MSEILVLPKKERLIVQHLRDFIDNDPDNTVSLVAGIRRIGKTTALKQLQASYPGAVYIDLQEEGTGLNAIKDALLNSSVRVLLLDEITYLDEFERAAEFIYDMSTKQGRSLKIVITGSSSAHITKLYQTKLGGGRACLFRLPPITFVEYLYMTGRISNYEDYANASNQDFVDYLLLKDLTPDLRIQFDDKYFDTFYKETAESNENRLLTHSHVSLNADDLTTMTDLIAYRVSDACRYKKTMEPKVGGVELFGIWNRHPEVDLEEIDLSDAFIHISKDKAPGISVQDKGRILSFMLWSGLASCSELNVLIKQETRSITEISRLHL